MITPVQVGDIDYYYVNRNRELPGGITVSEWSVYDNTGQVLPEFYDGVKVKPFGFFEVVKGGKRFIVDKTGKVVYAFL